MILPSKISSNVRHDTHHKLAITIHQYSHRNLNLKLLLTSLNAGLDPTWDIKLLRLCILLELLDARCEDCRAVRALHTSIQRSTAFSQDLNDQLVLLLLFREELLKDVVDHSSLLRVQLSA